MSALKDMLKKILPPPVNSFMREVNRIVAIEEQNNAMIQQLAQKVDKQEQLLQKQHDILQKQSNEIVTLENTLKAYIQQLHDVNVEKLNQQISMTENEYKNRHLFESSLMQTTKAQVDLLEQLNKTQEVIKTDAKAARNHAWKSQKNSDEILWAEIFHDASSNSTWLHDKAFSAGRWAVGYQYLYSVYRILDEVKPKSILELGLGQSTRLLGQYASANNDISHMVVEHDPSWIEFFQQDFLLGNNTTIVQLEREYIKFCEDEKVLAFKDFYETFRGQKFDFISIDAPLGGEAIIYARVDILNLLPECLAESFVIVVDDYNRYGEKNMVAILEMILKENDISYVKGVYSGQKDCVVICSENLKFVCSM